MAQKRKQYKRQSRQPQQQTQRAGFATNEAMPNNDDSHLVLRNLEIVSSHAYNFRPRIIEMLNEAHTLASKNKNQEAIELYRQIIQEEPRAHTAYSNLTALMYRSGDDDAAIELMKSALQKYPRVVTLRVNMARICIRQKQLNEASKHLLALESVNRFTSEEFYNYAMTWSQLFAAKRDYKGAGVWLRLLSNMVPGALGLHVRRFFYWILGLFQRTPAGGVE